MNYEMNTEIKAPRAEIRERRYYPGVGMTNDIVKSLVMLEGKFYLRYTPFSFNRRVELERVSVADALAMIDDGVEKERIRVCIAAPKLVTLYPPGP